MEVFIVTRDGRSIAGIAGVTGKEHEATNAARQLIQAEPDDYHGYSVWRFELDRFCTMDPKESFGWGELVGEGTLLYTVRRKGSIVTTEAAQ